MALERTAGSHSLAAAAHRQRYVSGEFKELAAEGHRAAVWSGCSHQQTFKRDAPSIILKISARESS
jgi:hypothetical protein